MSSYNRNEIAYCCTKEGMHEKAAELKIEAWALGCNCQECCKAFEKVLNSEPNTVGKGEIE